MFERIFSKKFLAALSFVAFVLPACANAQAGLVNINTADLATLDTLPGIGPAIAQRIIDYRNANGPFNTIEEIMNVSGIGPTTFENMKSSITVSAGTENPSPQQQQVSQTSNTTSQSSTSGGSSSASVSPVVVGIPVIGVGEDRVGFVGTPMEFRVEKGASTGGKDLFKWNFGDGTQGGGLFVTHIYEYPGEYIVVLLASFPQGDAVAKVNVKITEPQVTISTANLERIEFSNPSNQEVNLFGQAISAGGKVFMFPKGTFIGPGARTSFSSKVTGLTPSHANEVEWVAIGENRDIYKVSKMVEERKEEKIATIKNEIQVLEQRVAVARASSYSPTVVAVAQVEPVEEIAETDPSLASAVLATDAIKKAGWWDKVKKFLMRTR